MRLLLVLAASLALVVGMAGTARASASARLVYVRGPGAERCPGEPAIRAAVSARLGYDPFFPWAHDALFVEVTRAGSAFHVELKLVDADNLQRGARELTVKGADCAAVVDAMALTISLTIDPDSLTRGPQPPPPAPAPLPAPPAPPEPAPAPPAPAAVVPERTERPDAEPASLHAHLGVGVGASFAAAPAPAAGATLFAGARWRALSLDLEGRFDLPATGQGNDDARVSVRSWIAAGSLAPCVHAGLFYGCGVGSLGWLTATGVSGTTPQTHGALWAAAGPRVGIELELSPSFALRGWGEALVTLARSTLVIANDQSVHGFGPVSGGATVAVVWRFL